MTTATAGASPAASDQDLALAHLVQTGRLAPTTAEAAREAAGGPSALYRLVAGGAVSPADAAAALQHALGWPAVDLSTVSPDADLCALLPADEAAALRLALLSVDSREMVAAVTDPYHRDAVDRARRCAQEAGNFTVRFVIADEHSLERWVERAYHANGSRLQARADLARAAVEDAGADSGTTALEEAVKAAEIPSLVTEILDAAVTQGASDVHIEWYDGGGRVRFRKNGSLYTVMPLDAMLTAGLSVHIKHRAGMDSTRTLAPADGAFKVTLHRQKLGIRVSTLPTLFGEKIVMRIHGAGKLSRLADLAIPARELNLLLDAIQRPNKMVLVTGPTGSGKTTTLYAALDEINDDRRNIMSAEDPPERELWGINQVEINEHHSRQLDRSHEAVLKSFLRQDPDVILYGEVRDGPAARTLFRAALTGHLVFSTLHTMDGAETIERLADIGIERYNIVGAVRIIVSQRLVPALCAHCRRPDRPDELTILSSGLTADEIARLAPQTSPGCDHCRHSGFSGRFGLYEVMEMTPAVARLVVTGAPASDIRAAARQQGMTTLREWGLRAVADGRTSLPAALAQINF